jgi:hypothetical protein
MSRFVQRSVLVAGLAGALLAFGPARADAPRAPGIGCYGSAYDRPGCRAWRTAHRRVRTYRPSVADMSPRIAEPAFYGASRYVSLLVLGVGY